jgi:hypothetical protein
MRLTSCNSGICHTYGPPDHTPRAISRETAVGHPACGAMSSTDPPTRSPVPVPVDLSFPVYNCAPLDTMRNLRAPFPVYRPRQLTLEFLIRLSLSCILTVLNRPPPHVMGHSGRQSIIFLFLFI